MKKVIGWIFLVCGIGSLPGLFSKLTNVQHAYDVIGMLIGQGLIFFLAYLCIKDKKG